MKTILFSILSLGILGGVFGGLLAFASKIFHVEVDPKQEAVRSSLAGANCGGCGFPGCDGTAKKLAEIMGVEESAAEAMIAFVRCSGGDLNAEKRFNYNGPEDCRAAMLFGGKSNRMCTFACIGLGNCTKACKFDAIHIENGVAVVNRHRCVGCGSCAEACPKNIIALIPKDQKVMPACSSTAKGPVVIKSCKVGCIGCMKCQRECPAEAIKVVDNLAVVDYSKCIMCGHCAEVCPRKIIRIF